MHLPHLLALPPAIIALCAATPGLAAEESQWPHNVPQHLKYFPEDEVHAKRGLSVKQRLQHEKPIGVKKMSMDEGEMFMLDNWIFAAQDTPSQPQSSRRSDYDVFGNATSQALSPLRPLAQRCGRYIDVLCPALYLFIHPVCHFYFDDCRRHSNHIIYNQHDPRTNIHLNLALRIHLLNRLVLMPRLPRRRLLHERSYLRNRRLLPRRRRQPLFHTRSRRPCSSYQRRRDNRRLQ
ncbi:unnamed protein product [Alternaria alternata]